MEWPELRQVAFFIIIAFVVYIGIDVYVKSFWSNVTLPYMYLAHKKQRPPRAL